MATKPICSETSKAEPRSTGQRFVSSSLKDYEFTDTAGEKAPHRHEVLFYSDDTVLLDRLARFVAAALKAGNAAIVLATKPRRDSLVHRLKAEGVDTDDALQRGTYVSLDAADTLSTIMDNDMPDPVRFFRGIGGLIEAAAKAAKPAQPQVVMFGEAVALLQAEGRADAAVRFNSAVPQSKQTTTSGNTHTAGLLRVFSPGKWMTTSAIGVTIWEATASSPPRKDAFDPEKFAIFQLS